MRCINQKALITPTYRLWHYGTRGECSAAPCTVLQYFVQFTEVSCVLFLSLHDKWAPLEAVWGAQQSAAECFTATTVTYVGSGVCERWLAGKKKKKKKKQIMCLHLTVVSMCCCQGPDQEEKERFGLPGLSLFISRLTHDPTSIEKEFHSNSRTVNC